MVLLISTKTPESVSRNTVPTWTGGCLARGPSRVPVALSRHSWHCMVRSSVMYFVRADQPPQLVISLLQALFQIA